jgi:hypothetical protein
VDGASHISARPERVLLVDDDQDILRFIEMLMRREGFGDTGLGVGGDGYITKPFDPDDFVHVAARRPPPRIRLRSIARPTLSLTFVWLVPHLLLW